MRFSIFLIFSLFLLCGKPVVHRDTTLPEPVVMHTTIAAIDSVDRHDSIFTVVEIRHDTLQPDCPPNVTTTTSKVSTVSNRSAVHDTIPVEVRVPYEVRDTIYRPGENIPVLYSPFKIIGWLFLGIAIGAVGGFFLALFIRAAK